MFVQNMHSILAQNRFLGASGNFSATVPFSTGLPRQSAQLTGRLLFGALC